MEHGLVVLSFGGGQDSTAILYKIILDISFKEKYVGNKHLVVVFSDTGNEHPVTYQHIIYIRELCLKYNIVFIELTPDKKYHSEAWQSLEHQFQRNDSIAMKRVKSCTDNLKIKPIYRWLDHYCSELLGKPSRDHVGKTHIVEYAQKNGPIEMLIGFAKGEENRARKAGTYRLEKWWSNIKKVYPLLEVGMSRGDCIEYMKGTTFRVCMPSNCIMCPNISKQELIYLWRFQRKEFEKWELYEQNKLRKNAHKERNVGALGNVRTLREELKVALEKFGDWTDEQIVDYKMSHGHCISNGY